MKLIHLTAAVLLLLPIAGNTANSASDRQTSKAANMVCAIDKECTDLVSIQLDGMYFLGLNERDPASIGTLINRKAKSLQTFCEHAEDRKVCETYRNQLMLKYITGLLDR